MGMYLIRGKSVELITVEDFGEMTFDVVIGGAQQVQATV